MSMEFLFGLIAGYIIEAIVGFVIKLIRTTSGTLRIDKTNPEKDSYCINIDDLDALEKKKRVELTVSVINGLSQK